MIELVDVRKVFNQEKPNEFVAIHGTLLATACTRSSWGPCVRPARMEGQ